MKIIVVGGTGNVGKAVVNEFKKDGNNEVITVGFSKGDVNADMTSIESINNMYKKIGKFDALVATLGKVKFAPLQGMDTQGYKLGLDNKLMGQVNLVLEGLKHINKAGSFTLTSGILNEQPILGGSSAAMVNSAIEGFVKSSALEMQNGVRINAVSPTVLTEALDVYADFFKGFEPVSAKQVALAYAKSVYGIHNGIIYKVGF